MLLFDYIEIDRDGFEFKLTRTKEESDNSTIPALLLTFYKEDERKY